MASQFIYTFSGIAGGGPGVVGCTTAFHAKFRGSFLSLGDLKETIICLSHPFVKLSIVGSLHDREVACTASDLQSLNVESCVWRALSSYHSQEVILAQFSLYVHKSGQKSDSFYFIFWHHTLAVRAPAIQSGCGLLYSLQSSLDHLVLLDDAAETDWRISSVARLF